MKAARDVQRDLEWTQKKVKYAKSISITLTELTRNSALNARAAQKYPEQYRAARERYAADDY
jgi:biogenesis of lysosome-related organelles complex 1 subunit KXD1